MEGFWVGEWYDEIYIVKEFFGYFVEIKWGFIFLVFFVVVLEF